MQSSSVGAPNHSQHPRSLSLSSLPALRGTQHRRADVAINHCSACASTCILPASCPRVYLRSDTSRFLFLAVRKRALPYSSVYPWPIWPESKQLSIGALPSPPHPRLWAAKSGVPLAPPRRHTPALPKTCLWQTIMRPSPHL
ncbi:hypothetical protein C2E23DRAFT_807047 [Lenzites betulinus]|nr:hypothetical protein C2E23DRAFT_807047 [Lenzites betulinus]